MSDYKPSFIFQSKLTNQTGTVDVETLQVNQQADQSNTMGSVSITLNPVTVVGVGTGLLVEGAEQIISVITGGLFTTKDLFDNPDFQCSIVSAAAEYACGQVQACPAPKEILAIKKVSDPKTKKTTFEVDCGCPDEEANDLLLDEDGNNLETISGAIDNCQRKNRNAALKTCLGSLDDLFEEMVGTGYVPWNLAVELIKNEIDLVINDENIDPISKANRVLELINQLQNIILSNGWEIDYPEQALALASATEKLQGKITECSNSVANDCTLNITPSIDQIKTVLKTISPKPEKKCPKVTETNKDGVRTYGKVLSDACDCVCPSGIPCPNGDYCIDCSEMGGIAVFEGDVGIIPIGIFPLPIGLGVCKCVCPEGQRRYSLGNGKQSPCVPECAKGLVFAELPCSGSGAPIAYTDNNGTCYGCACRQNTGGPWPFSNYVVVTNEYCNSTLKNSIMDPEDACRCICPYGWNKKQNPNGSDEYKCLPPCPEGSRRDYHTEECVCYSVSSTLGVVDEPCPSDTTTNPDDPCGCICNDPKKTWDRERRRCSCSLPPSGPVPGCAETASRVLDPETCDCVCPEGFCANGGRAIAKGIGTDDLRCECICTNTCPEGTLRSPNCECIVCVDGNCSGGVGVASYTTNIVPNKINGYSVIESL